MAAVRASTEAIGLCHLADGWGINVDSWVALVVARKGNGKLRHVIVGNLWLQEAEANGDLFFRMVHGLENTADLFTKTLAADRVRLLSEALSLYRFEGCVAEGLAVRPARHEPAVSVVPRKGALGGGVSEQVALYRRP